MFGKTIFCPPYTESLPCWCRFACGNFIFPYYCSKILSVGKIKTNLKFYRTGAGKSTFRTQNDTELSNFRYTAKKKSLIRERIASRSCVKIRLFALDTKYIFLNLRKQFLLNNQLRRIKVIYFSNKQMIF